MLHNLKIWSTTHALLLQCLSQKTVGSFGFYVGITPITCIFSLLGLCKKSRFTQLRSYIAIALSSIINRA